jgi:hypothetical protein
MDKVALGRVSVLPANSYSAKCATFLNHRIVSTLTSSLNNQINGNMRERSLCRDLYCHISEKYIASIFKESNRFV